MGDAGCSRCRLVQQRLDPVGVRVLPVLDGRFGLARLDEVEGGQVRQGVDDPGDVGPEAAVAGVATRQQRRWAGQAVYGGGRVAGGRRTQSGLDLPAVML